MANPEINALNALLANTNLNSQLTELSQELRDGFTNMTAQIIAQNAALNRRLDTLTQILGGQHTLNHLKILEANASFLSLNQQLAPLDTLKLIIVPAVESQPNASASTRQLRGRGGL